MIDVNKIREDFPILRQSVYNKPLVYLDNAATTQKPLPVINKIVELYSTQNANIHRGVHYLSQLATQAHEQARSTVARFIGAKSSAEIVFTRGTTESVNLVAYSWVDAFCEEGDEIIITQMEHHSNIVPWQLAAERKGLIIKVLPINQKGELRVDMLDELLTKRTKLVSFAYVSNVLGSVNPVQEIVEKAHKAGALVLLDAAQAIAHIKVDVAQLGVDFLAFSGHKVYAPNGIGVLWGRKEIFDQMPPFQGGGEMIENVTFEKTTFNVMPYKYEAGTPDYIGSVALAQALEYIDKIGMDNIQEYEHQLLEYATEKIRTIEGIELVGQAQNKSGVLSFNVSGVHPYDIGMLLDKCGIAVRTGHHCAQPLIDYLGIKGTVRASFAFYNTFEEVDFFIDKLKRVVTMLK